MRTKLIVSTIIVAIGILLITGAINTDVEAIAPTEISDCDDDSSVDGDRLVLTDDIGLNDDCILISHDNVTLDCSGFMIDGVSDTGVGVNVTANGVTVKNCIIRNFSIGINLENSGGSTITKNTLTLNDLGINLEYGSDDNTITANNSTDNDVDGIRIVSSHFNKIARNTLIENIHGIRINNSDNNIITLNIATGNTLNGIMLLNADSNTIKKNTSNNNHRNGISVCDMSDFNILTLNTANNNDDNGISVCDMSDSNILTLNTANSNGLVGFIDLTSGGMGTAGTDNIYKRNNCSDNGADSNPGLCS